jgi:hypothetical protein
MKNTLPTPPSSFTTLPTAYANPPITVSWSGTIPGSSAIKNYVLQQQTSSDGSTWSSWGALTTVASSSTSGSYIATPSNVEGVRTRYRLAVTDVLDAMSGFVVSNIVMKQLARKRRLLLRL